MTLRSPICTVIGHIDHGKSSILDYIRGSAIVSKEAGAITQAIGASIVPADTIRKVIEDAGLPTQKISVNGLLFIDTPGHAAFNNLRKRGGNLADIAIIVIDINEGAMPQTIECINIMKEYKTPFIIAANKIDLLPGWKSQKGPVITNISSQNQSTTSHFENKLYEIVGKLSEFGYDSDRFDRVEDFSKKVAVVPVSAKTGSGIPELLMIIAGLAQKFLELCLECTTDGFARGTVLEVKEEKGLGKTLDIIIYDGTLKRNDTIVIGSLADPIITKVKALFEPAPLSELRDKKSKFSSVQSVQAATGLKLSAQNIEGAVAGMPMRSCDPKDAESVAEEIREEVEEVIIESDDMGLIVKADSLGSLEAMITLLREKGIPIRKATIGNITKKDIADAQSNHEKDPFLAAILGFNVEDNSGLCYDTVKVITHPVIYQLIDEYEKWKATELKKIEERELAGLPKPCKIQVLRGYVFRQSNPAVVGIDVLEGKLKIGTPLMREDGTEVSIVKDMQMNQDHVEEAGKGTQLAISVPNITVGRHINEGDILVSAIPEDEFRKLKELKKALSGTDKDLLREVAGIRRKNNPVWGI